MSALNAEEAGPAPAAVDPTAADPGHAAFNPFGTVGVVVAAPAPIAPDPPGGDLALPVVATLAGFAVIGWMLRAMLQ